MLAAAGEANRGARGCGSGVYPITPQTEIIEYLTAYALRQGRRRRRWSPSTAPWAVCIGASLAGARSFTASSSNGLLYMTENVFAAGYYRLPIVMMAVNRTLGPPWNIWVDHGDTLALRDAAWLQLYCESHQDLVDTILLAFRVAEDPRVLLPAMVSQDGFVLSHTLMDVDLPDAGAGRRATCRRSTCRTGSGADHPRIDGGLTWPRETERHREEIQAAMERGAGGAATRRSTSSRASSAAGPRGAFPAAAHRRRRARCSSPASTMARTAAAASWRRAARAGEKVGLVRAQALPAVPAGRARARRSAARSASAVLDRNHSPGSGGIFWSEIATSLAGAAGRRCVQDYIVGLGGGDVAAAAHRAASSTTSPRASAPTPPVFVLEAA